jgi:SAM-dependent methyltransferase
MDLKKRCKDIRCIFYSREDSKHCNFTSVTTETREGRGLWEKCAHCGLVINRSAVDPKEAEDFYNKTYVEKNSYSAGELLTARSHFESRLTNIKAIADSLKPYLKKDMRVFELGAATGELLYLIKDSVNYCYANEINQLYTTFIKNELQIDASYEDYFKLKFSKQFDMIIAINTIDHMYDTLGAVEKIHSDLKSDGYFYVEVPNDEQALKEHLPDPQRTMFKNFMYQKAHYYSFTFNTLRKLLEQTGFKIIEEYSRHDYTLINYLNWYFMGKPQRKLKSAMEDTGIHTGDSDFEKQMNELFKEFDVKFRKIMMENKVGESICILAQKK